MGRCGSTKPKSLIILLINYDLDGRKRSAGQLTTSFCRYVENIPQLIPQPEDFGAAVWQKVESDWPRHLLLAARNRSAFGVRYDPERDDDGVTMILSSNKRSFWRLCLAVARARRRLAERSRCPAQGCLRQ